MTGKVWTFGDDVNIRMLHTPGHTGDHVCLFDAEAKLLLSGDHVLPTITPHVPGLSPLADPLGSYLESLQGLRRLGEVSLVLPAHGPRFRFRLHAHHYKREPWTLTVHGLKCLKVYFIDHQRLAKISFFSPIKI